MVLGMKTFRLIAVSIFLAITVVIAQVQTPFRTGDVILRGGWLFEVLDLRSSSRIANLQ